MAAGFSSLPAAMGEHVSSTDGPLRLAVDQAARNALAWRERRARVLLEGSALDTLVTTWAPMPADTADYRANHAKMIDYRLQCLADAIQGFGVSR